MSISSILSFSDKAKDQSPRLRWQKEQTIWKKSGDGSQRWLVYLKNINKYLKCQNRNASKFIEKYFLDLRNIFLNQENIRKFFSKQENLSN